MNRYLILLLISPSFVAGCISQFLPEVDEKTNMLVVEGMVTDRNRAYKIKISRSLPLGKPLVPKPVKGCEATIIDENGTVYSLKEVVAGTYITDSTKFIGRVGSEYTLKINSGSLTYVSSSMEMVPVPPIDSLYYKKELISESNEWGKPEEGCRIYLNTYDPFNKCFFYRWDFSETWEFNLHYDVKNQFCWITQNSGRIIIKNTMEYDQSRVTKFPLHFISNNTDMLSVKYSILVTQYSLNGDEFNYWEELQNVTENVGGLYDVFPMLIPSNIYNIDDPEETVLGYFSVSAVTQKRIFIKEKFSGLPDIYWYCPTDTVWGFGAIPGLNTSVWLLEDHPFPFNQPPWRVTTIYRECADCTTRGTNVRPSYWDMETLF